MLTQQMVTVGKTAFDNKLRLKGDCWIDNPVLSVTGYKMR